MLAALLDLLTRPGSFFAARERPLVRYAALAVAASALPTVGVALLFVYWFRKVIPPEALALAAAAVVVVVGLLRAVAWLGAAGLLYALSYPLAGRGGGRRLLAYVGWGLVPQCVTGLVALAAAALLLSQFPAPTDQSGADAFARQLSEAPSLAVAVAAGTARATARGTVGQVETATGVAGALWSGYVWTAAVERARGLRRRYAAAAAAVPTLALVAFAL